MFPLYSATGGPLVELSIAEAAERIGVTKIALRNKVTRGTVAAIKGDDGQWRVRVEERNSEWIAIPATGRSRSRRYTPMHDRDVQPDSPATPVSVDPVRRAEQLTVVQEILAPFIAELGSVREELGRERILREQAERERDDLRQRLEAPHAPERPGDDESRVTSGNTSHSAPQREPEASWRVRLRRWLGWE